MAARDFTRRDFQRISLASAFGAAACPWLPRLAAAADKKPAKACIVLWMTGGPSQTDTWDLKPDQAVAATDQDERRRMLAELQGDFDTRHGGAAAKAHAAAYRKAQRMIDTEAKGGFRLDEEPAKLRDAYGRNRFGQGCLLARRLLERGVAFVEVSLDGWHPHA